MPAGALGSSEHIFQYIPILECFHSHWDDFVIIYPRTMFGAFIKIGCEFGVFFKLLG
jgi:hypothetical protein